MEERELIWIMMWLFLIFAGIGVVGSLFEIIMRRYFSNKIDISDLQGRLASGEELHFCNMFGDNHNFIGINDSDSYYCINKGCKEIQNSWEVNNGFTKIS